LFPKSSVYSEIENDLVALASALSAVLKTKSNAGNLPSLQVYNPILLT
jgi:hypothetical protein